MNTSEAGNRKLSISDNLQNFFTSFFFPNSSLHSPFLWSNVLFTDYYFEFILISLICAVCFSVKITVKLRYKAWS